MGNTPESLFEDAIREAKPYRFPGSCPHKECQGLQCVSAINCAAFKFHAGAYQHALSKCNVFQPPSGLTEFEKQLTLNKLMSTNGVRLSKNREFLLGEWWKAIYIYKHGDLVAFITEPKLEKAPVMTTDKYPALTVRTNVKL